MTITSCELLKCYECVPVHFHPLSKFLRRLFLFLYQDKQVRIHRVDMKQTLILAN